MKKLFSLLLAVALIASLSVCAFAEPALKVAVVLAGATAIARSTIRQTTG